MTDTGPPVEVQKATKQVKLQLPRQHSTQTRLSIREDSLPESYLVEEDLSEVEDPVDFDEGGAVRAGFLDLSPPPPPTAPQPRPTPQMRPQKRRWEEILSSSESEAHAVESSQSLEVDNEPDPGNDIDLSLLKPSDGTPLEKKDRSKLRRNLWRFYENLAW